MTFEKNLKLQILGPSVFDHYSHKPIVDILVDCKLQCSNWDFLENTSSKSLETQQEMTSEMSSKLIAMCFPAYLLKVGILGFGCFIITDWLK